MNELLYDIIVLENVLVAFREGASDEKRSAEYSLERLITSKKNAVKVYEDEVYEKEFKIREIFGDELIDEGTLDEKGISILYDSIKKAA